jgi:hypothetical protein
MSNPEINSEVEKIACYDEIKRRLATLESILDIDAYFDVQFEGYYNFLLEHGYHDNDKEGKHPTDEKNVRNYYAFHVMMGSQERTRTLAFIDFPGDCSAISYLDDTIQKVKNTK